MNGARAVLDFARTERRGERGFTLLWRAARWAPAFAGARASVNARGFTLLEMLVALAIFSLAGIALVRLQAVSARTAGDLDARVLAQMVARNVAYARMTDPNPPALGASQGTAENGGRRFVWQQVVAATGDRRLLSVTVRVEGDLGGSPAVLTVVRPAT